MIGLINRGNLPDSTQGEFENFAARLRELWLKEHNEDGTHRSAERDLNFVPVGAVLQWLTNTAPTGWRLCNGDALSRLTYKTLFDVITTTYGAGDGSTTFNIPDFRGRFALGKANAGTGASLAGTGGSIDHTHTGGTTGATAPGTSSDGAHDHGGTTGSESAHTHAITAHRHLINLADTAAAGADVSVGELQTRDDVNDQDNTGAGSAHSHTIASGGAHTHTVDSHTHTGGTTGTANPPYLVINFIIFTGVAD
jgi:microcystin-dependent protein